MMDYLKRMPFTIVFIDQKGRTYQDSSEALNRYIERHPMAVPRLHQPHFAAKILEMAAHSCGMRVVRRLPDSRVKRELYYVVRNTMFQSEEAMWAFINNPDNLNIVR
ncbi:hypothetical protein LVJ83_07655 [Uruburuella testudinis]|uniref:Uncharacterized protein n=1 Tax=Uruburuella testudinis TaxID=1282863 RepID=A0ABY4DQ57_9NEIS|nr:hypothetical protein [Uruburuella testudinis]UOO80864.1 hypothetical protein LVJ83_07655 [Uruburuella testudinis]